MSDPYRGAIARRCLICRDGPLDPDGDGFRCPRGCGLWDPTVPKVEGTSIAQLGRLIDPQLHPRRCLTCDKHMQIRRWSGLTFDVCAGHGVWVAGEDIAHYRSVTS